MVDDNYVKELLTEWLVLFGTREVSPYEVVRVMDSTGYDDNDLWEHVVGTNRLIYHDLQRNTWQLTDRGIKHLQCESDSV